LLEEFRQIVQWLEGFCDDATCEIDYSTPKGG